MKRFWVTLIQAVSTVPPAMRGRVIRHLITLLAGAGLIRGLSADQANAWQGLVEMGLSVAGFALAIWLSQTSDAKQLAKVTDPLSEEEIDAIVREVCKDKPVFANDNPNPSPIGPAPAIQTRPVSKYPTGEKGHNVPMNAEIAARKPAPTPAPPPAPFRGGVQ